MNIEKKGNTTNTPGDMKQYIDKAAVVAEIEKLYNLEYDNTSNLSCGKKIILRNILLFIDTFEVKEVDLQHEVESYWEQCDMTWCRDAYSMTHIRSMLSDIAKHFFELGLKAQKGE